MREHHSLVRQTEQQAKESLSLTKKRNTRQVQGCPLRTSPLTICTIMTWNLPGLRHHRAGDWELPGSGYTRRHSAPRSPHTESLGLKAAGFWGLQARVPSHPCLLTDSASSPLGQREHGAGSSCITYPALQLYSA